MHRFTIKKGETEGNYVIEGEIDSTQGSIKSFDAFVEGKSRFSMIVARDGVVVDNVGFRPRSAFGGIGNNMPFIIEYHQPEGFDMITFAYDVTVKG